MTFDVTASIVLYNNNKQVAANAIGSFLRTSLNVRLYLVDNSPTDILRCLSVDPRVEYIFNSSNLGFGKAHNLALRRCLDLSPYHLVLNPDVYFDDSVLPAIFAYMQQHPDTGQLMPLILYPDKQIQYAGQLLPSPVDLIARRLFRRIGYFKTRNEVYELCKTGYSTVLNVPNHLGCFMFLRTEALKQAGLFDEQIFMYTEDVDLTRRMHRHGKTIFYPHVSIYHHYEKGSQKKLRLLFYHIRSAVYYFNKWGWFSDPERVVFNKKAIREAFPGSVDAEQQGKQ